MRGYFSRLASLYVIGALLLVCTPTFSQNLPVDIVREMSLHSQNVVEESRITIMQSWDHPDLGRLRTGADVYRGTPAFVPGSSWLAYVSQSAIGSWIGSYAPMAFQTIDR